MSNKIKISENLDTNPRINRHYDFLFLFWGGIEITSFVGPVKLLLLFATVNAFLICIVMWVRRPGDGRRTGKQVSKSSSPGGAATWSHPRDLGFYPFSGPYNAMQSATNPADGKRRKK